METLALYMHVPFCLRRCGYCDFVTYAGCLNLVPEYVDALCNEVETYGQTVPGRAIRTVYFGGGTPSLLTPLQVDRVLETVRKSFPMVDSPEITLEANPGTEIDAYAGGYLQAGINRVSLGMQSADEAELRLLARIHDYPAGVRALSCLRSAGFTNINIDLIYGIPSQTLASWEDSLTRILELCPEHLSLYSLTLHPAAPLGKKALSGRISLPEDDLVAQMYDLAISFLEENGYEQYEISNWARKDSELNYQSLHNHQYWRAGEYIGAGAGAHGYLHDFRYENLHTIPTYLSRMNSGRAYLSRFPAQYRKVHISQWDSMQEFMMLGLRLTREGVSDLLFYERYGLSVWDVFSRPLRKLLAQGIIEWDEGASRIRLTRQGRHVANVAFREFVGIPEPSGLNRL